MGTIGTRAEVREVEGRQIWFVSVEDEPLGEAFEQGDPDENEDAVRERVVRTVTR